MRVNVGPMAAVRHIIRPCKDPIVRTPPAASWIPSVAQVEIPQHDAVPLPEAIAADVESRPRRCLVLYDGTCTFCHSAVRWLIKNDVHNRIKYCCLQSRLATQFVKGACSDKYYPRLVVREEGDDTCLLGADAIFKVLSYLPEPYSKWGTYLSRLPKSVLDLCYNPFLRQGYYLYGKSFNEILVLKEKELLVHFIDRPELLKRWKQMEALSNISTEP